MKTKLYKPINFTPFGKYADRQVWFTDFILMGRIFRNNVDEHDQFTHIYSQTIREALGRQYKEHIIIPLIENGVIECTNSYRNAKDPRDSFTLGYRLTRKYSNSKWEQYVITDKRLKQHLKNRKRFTRPTTLLGRQFHKYLKQMTITTSGESHKPEYQVMIKMIQNGEFYFHQCPYGRIHTNLTNLASDLRKHIKLDGQTVVNLDVASSQLIFVAHTLAILATKSNNWTDFLHFHTQHTQTNRVTTIFSVEAKKQFTTECENLLNISEKGDFYSFLADGLYEQKVGECRRLDVTNFQDKHQLKDLTFLYLYGPNYHLSNGRELVVYKVLKTHYPMIVSFITWLKESSGDYRTFAQNIQRIESNLLIKSIGYRLLDDYDHIPVLTIHDSYGTTLEHKDTVKRIMSEEFNKLGIHPTIREEIWK